MTKGEHERLSVLLEELGEAQQVIGKILRFGYNSTHPEDRTRDNRSLLEEELGHVHCILSIMTAKRDLSRGEMGHWSNAHAVKLQKWMKNRYED